MFSGHCHRTHFRDSFCSASVFEMTVYLLTYLLTYLLNDSITCRMLGFVVVPKIKYCTYLILVVFLLVWLAAFLTLMVVAKVILILFFFLQRK